ncbi:SDR family NAD(P)-dependent oxidoreductase [Streptomyces sp. NPDC102274]|uniref:SDR family NAD(P)-dependent oxidoreductase n=1 Tax=Streptomyces sp. NPDC102274 TaxID=3366151 RepID=UPI00382E5013
MKTLDQKVAIITGATSGIGARIADVFVRAGAHVVLAGRREAEGKAVAESLGGTAGFIRADVSAEEDVEALVTRTVERHGRLDIMVNNAGTPGNRASVSDFDGEVFRRTLAVHVHGAMYGTKHAARQMLTQRSGSIINMASLAGKAAGWSGMDYSTAKAAVLHLTRCAAMDLGEHGIRVNSVSPGFVPTGIFAKGAGVAPSAADGSVDALAVVFDSVMKRHQAIETPVSTDDVAEAVLWLAGDASRLVTGQDIGVDAGTSVGRPSAMSREEFDSLRGLLAPRQ